MPNFVLVNKLDEIVDKVSIGDVGKNGAKTYFMGRKQLSEKQFDKLFEVKKAKDYHIPPLDYKWWKEERTNLDLEK